MKRLLASLLVAGTLLGLGAGTASAHDRDRDRGRDRGVTVYGLTTNDRVVTFRVGDPSRIRDNEAIQGLGRQETIVGFDRRPADGRLYAVTRRRTGAARLYTIDPGSGWATLIAPLVNAPGTAAPGTPVFLAGGEFGVDFNPAADALRIVSDAGQNLRVIPSPRTLPTGVALATGDTFTDGSLNRDGAPAIGITGAAYANNDNDPATGTTLYDIDAVRDELVVQNPPNNGTLVFQARLSQRTGPLVGFDIRTADMVDTAYASLTERRYGDRTSRLVRVDLMTGRITDLGQVGTNRPLRDIAL
jgi:hypothetical protein